MSVIYYHTMPDIKEYYRPTTVKEAISLLASHGKNAKILAGGTDLLVSMRSRDIVPRYIIDITGIKELSYIKEENDKGMLIGAATTIREIELSHVIKEKYHLLHEAASKMGNIQVNNSATAVGNICRASPSADMACPLLALKANVKVIGQTKTKTVPLSEFSVGSYKTVLGKDDMVTEIQIPKLAPGTGTAFLRTTRVATDLSKVNVSVVLTIKDGICKDISIVLGSVAPTLLQATAAEVILKGKKMDQKLIEESAQAAADMAHPRAGSLRASPEYKKHMARVLCRQAITTALLRAK
jgi:carbon-monoxide dehydrogenase medium subunit